MNAFVPKPLLDSVQTATVGKPITIAQAVAEGLALWLENRGVKASTPAAAPRGPYTASADPQLHELLDKILDNGDRKTVALLKQNIELIQNQVKTAPTPSTGSAKKQRPA